MEQIDPSNLDEEIESVYAEDTQPTSKPPELNEEKPKVQSTMELMMSRASDLGDFEQHEQSRQNANESEVRDEQEE